MKMVIRGAQAPKCDKKPMNPTSASHVGTMSGQAAGDKRAGKGAVAVDAHMHQYQGLLQAPRLPGKLDAHGVSPESQGAGEVAQDDLASASARRRGPTAGQAFMTGQPGDSIKHDQTVGASHGLNLLPGDLGKPPKTSQPQQHRAKTGQRYHYQKFGGQSVASFGGVGGQRGGAAPGQKSIKQQRDLAQLRFYQTLTNQPHLISQSHSQGKQMQQIQAPSQVKMLSSMRLAQQPSRSLNWGRQQAQDAQGYSHENQHPMGQATGLAAEGRRSYVGDQLQQRFDALGSGQPTLRPSQVSHLEAPALGRGQAQDQFLRQMRAKTPQRAGTGAGLAGGAGDPFSQVEVVGGAVGRGAAATNDLQAGKPRAPGRGGSQAGRMADGRQPPQDGSGKDAQPSTLAGQAPFLGAADNDRMEALRAENLAGSGAEGQTDQASRNLAGRTAMSAAGQPGSDMTPQGQAELAEISNKGGPEAAEYGVGDDPYEQKRGPQNAPSRTDDAHSRADQGGQNLQLLSHILNGPVPPAASQAQRDAFSKSNPMRQHEVVRNSESGIGGVRANNAMSKDGARRSHSPRARNHASSISREREGKGSPTRRGKAGPIHIAKIEKKHFNQPSDKARGAYNIGGPEEDFNRRMERFSSQGQEELVQAYQLPTVYAGNDSKAGFQGFQSQQSKKRNQTSYGGPRAKAGAAGRNYEYLRESINSIPRMAGGGAYSSASGNQLVSADRQLAILQQPSQPSQAYQQAGSKGALSNILVKTCSFQAREAATQKREQIRTAYTITRAGRQGMGVLPQIDAKVSSLQDVTRDTEVHGVVHGTDQVSSAIDGTAGRGAASINLPDAKQGQQRVDSIQLGKAQQEADTRVMQEYQAGKKQGRSSVASRVSAPAPCKRFMERGNKPVPNNYEEQDVVTDLKKVETAVVAYQNPDDGPQRGGNAGSAMTNMSGKAVSRQSGRQMVYGNLKLGHFDEEINGINLSKLFSVYGPQSAEGNRRKKVRQSHQSGGIQQLKNKDISKSSPQRAFDSYQQQKSSQQYHNVHALPLQVDRQSRTGAGNRLGKDVNTSSMIAGAANAPAAGRSGDLTANDQNTSPINDKSKSGVGNLKMEGRDHASTDLDRQQLDDQRLTTEHQEDFDNLSDEDESDDEEEEPLIIQLMESMFTRKKTVQESEQMISEISVEAIRQEIRRLALLEKCRLTTLQRQKFFEQRMNDCEKLNELIKRENQDLSESILERPDLSTRENPFYLALKAQKEERDRYKQLLQLAIMNGVSGDKDGEQSNDSAEAAKNQQIEDAKEDGANDIFKHTFVDILDDDKTKPGPEENVIIDNDQKLDKKPKDIFYFYNLSFDLPTEYYKQLGDFSVINRAQANKIKEFMIGFWPMLKGKKVQYKIAFDQNKEVFNVVLLGKDCPLSKCCKMTVYFQFTKDIGGKVICMENLCALNPLDHFNIELDLVKTLFYDYPLGQQPAVEADHQGYQDGNPDLVKQLVTNEAMSKQQYKRMKPTFKKIISQEISKMISKGTHHSLSIRDVIQNQNLEEKVHHQMNKGRATNKLAYVPKRLTQSKLLKLLYDTSSQASSQLSHLGMNDQQAYDGDSGQQPMGSIQFAGNEDLGFGMDNQAQYGGLNNQIYVGQVPQEYPVGLHGLNRLADNQNIQNEQQHFENNNIQYTQISMDELLLAAQAAERGEQPAILFSHTVQDKMGNEEAQGQHLVPLGPGQISAEQQEFRQAQEQRALAEAMNQGNPKNMVVGSHGTFNPGPSIVVKPKPAEQLGQQAQPLPSQLVQVDGQPSDLPHQERTQQEGALQGSGAAAPEGAAPVDSTQAN